MVDRNSGIWWSFGSWGCYRKSMMTEAAVRILRADLIESAQFSQDFGFKDDQRRAVAAINALSIVLGELPMAVALPRGYGAEFPHPPD